MEDKNTIAERKEKLRQYKKNTTRTMSEKLIALNSSFIQVLIRT